MEKIVNLNGNAIKINIINEYSTSNMFGERIILYTNNTNSIPQLAYMSNIGIKPVDDNEHFIELCIDKINELIEQNEDIDEAICVEPAMKVFTKQKQELMGEISDITSKINSIQYKKDRAYEIVREERGILTDSLKNEIDNAFEQVKQKLQRKIKDKQDEINEISDYQEEIVENSPKYLEKISYFRKETKTLLDLIHDCKSISNINLNKSVKKQIEKFETLKKEVAILEFEKNIYEGIESETGLSKKDLKDSAILQERLNKSKEKLKQIESEYINIGDYTVLSNEYVVKAYQRITAANRTIAYMRKKLEEQQQKKEQEEKQQRIDRFKRKQREQENERQKRYRQIQKERIEHNENAKYDSELLDTSLEGIIREEKIKEEKEILKENKEATIKLLTEDSPFFSTIYNKIKDSKFANSNLGKKISADIKNKVEKKKIKFKRHMERRKKFKKILNEMSEDLNRKYK